jgi:guanine nucleotide-binding protein G(i) subunit alpha
LENSWLKEIQRISQPDYVPTESDILRIRDGRAGIREYTFTMGSINIRVVDPEAQQPKLRKMLHQFEGVTSIIFVVDLSSYDAIDPLSVTSQTLMMEALELFDWVVNHRWFVRSSIILFLNNVERFKQKLVKLPLRKYFPDFSGGNDPGRAAKYIFSRFNQVNRGNLRVYAHLTNSTDSMSNILNMFSAIKDTIIQSTLRDSNIL